MKYRSRTEIVAQMLSAAVKPATETKIMYDAFLSFTQVKEYLKVLVDNELLDHDDKNDVYRTADKGRRFLHIYSNIDEFVSSYKQPLDNNIGNQSSS